MKEFNPLQTTETDLKLKSGSLDKEKQTAKLISPIQQLELKVSINDREDYQQVQKILTTILQYPSQQLAQIHREANRLGNRDIQEKVVSKNRANQLTSKAQYCSCCGFVKQQYQIKLCQKLDDIYNLGLSTFLYFQTIKNLAIILIEMIVIYGIYALATNVIASGKFTNCGTTVTYSQCSSNLDYLSISLGSKQNNQTQQNKFFYYIQAWIGVAMVIIWLLTFFVLKYFQKNKQIQVDTQTISASDFSIVIQNVPEDFTQEQLQAQLNQYQKNITSISKALKKPLKIRKFNKGKPFHIENSNLKDQNLTKLQQQQKQMINKFAQWILQRQNSRSFTTTKEQRLQLYKKYSQNLAAQQKLFEQVNKKMKQQFLKKDSQSNTIVFVTLDTNHAKDMITTLNPNDYASRFRNFITCSSTANRLLLKHKNNQLKIKVQRAPQPQDVIWSNIGFSDWQKLKRKLLTYFVTVVMLGVSFAAVYGLSLAQISNSGNQYLSILISLVISVINFLISKSIIILSLYEHDYTTIKYQTSLAIKSVLAQLINSILVPMFANYFIKSNIYDKNGLADDIFMLGITSSLIPPIMKFVDIGYYIGKIMTWYYSKTDKKLYINQLEFNKLYIGIQFQIGFQYIYVVNLFIFVCFFVSLQPIISLFALFGYFLMFWAQKWALFNRMRRPVPGNDLINQAMGQLIFLGPLAYSLGSLTWSNFFPQGIPKYALLPNLIATGISVLTLIFPLSLIFACILQKNAQAQTTYEDNRVFLSAEYDRLNPITAQQGFKDYMDHLEKIKQKMKNATEQEKQKMAKKFDLNAQRGHQAMNAQNMNMAQGNMFFPGVAMFGGPQMPFQMMNRPMFPPMMMQPPQMMMMPQQPIYRPPVNVTPQFGNSQINQSGFQPQNMGINQQSKPVYSGPQMNQQPQPQPQILGFQQPGFQQPGFQQPGFQQPGFQQPGFQQPGFQQPQQFQQPFRPQYQQPFNPFNFNI